MARPKKILDYELIEKLANILCTQEEIASISGCDVRTLQRDSEFCRVYKKGQDGGKTSLRRAQFKSALSGNSTMLVWLGKQYLNQREIPEDTEKSIDKIEEILVSIKNTAINQKVDIKEKVGD